MPARKRAKNCQEQVQRTEPNLAAPPSFGQSHRGLEEEIADYPEVQRNEFLTTRAIYPDEFERVRGRKDAWKVSSSGATYKALLLTVPPDPRELSLQSPSGTA